jgi:hypothetical protein
LVTKKRKKFENVTNATIRIVQYVVEISTGRKSNKRIYNLESR